MNRCIGIWRTVFITLIAIGIFWSLSAAEGRRTVRVGHFTAVDYQERDANGRMVGYSNEYLQRIARIASWDIEYVHGTLNEVLEMLREGKVDMVGFLSKTPEREAMFNFPGLHRQRRIREWTSG